MNGGTKLAFQSSARQEPRLLGLLDQIRAKNTAALAELYDETSTRLYSLAVRILHDPADAEEVVIDVYNFVWRSAQAFDASRGTVFSWLCILTRSRAIDRLRTANARRKKEVPSEVLLSPAPGPEIQAIGEEQQRIVAKALESLSVTERAALEMAYFRGLTHVEIAEELREPLGTIKTRIRTAVRKLRGVVAPYTEL